MKRHTGHVLVDTNVIPECHRTGSWHALTGSCRVETVADCVMETQTGLQRRRKEQRIDESKLRKSQNAVHTVEDRERSGLIMRSSSDIILDVGEASLWAHAVNRNDDWVPCGPDKASLCFGIRLGLRERLESLERLLDAIGHRPEPAYARKWHDKTVGEFILAEPLEP